MACIVMGDSIAVGVGMARPECASVAHVGINSARFVKTKLDLTKLGAARADTVIISLGVNDGPAAHTADNLRIVRRAVQARTVYWLLPGLRDYARNAILIVAHEFGDRMIDTRPEAGRDHLHPSGAGYRRIAAMTRVGASQLTENKPLQAKMPDAHAIHPVSVSP